MEIICQILAKQKYCFSENTVELSEIMMLMQLFVEYFHYCQTLTEEMIDIWTDRTKTRVFRNRGDMSTVTFSALRLSNLNCGFYRTCHTVRHPRCVFINYNWINQLSNTTVWWLDICCLLHRYQLNVSALMAISRLID